MSSFLDFKSVRTDEHIGDGIDTESFTHSMDARYYFLCDDLAVFDNVEFTKAIVASVTVFKRVVLAEVFGNATMSAARCFAERNEILKVFQLGLNPLG